jgi:hypothetical protein
LSYEIDVSSVTAVLLADGWHRVKARTFGIEPFGYVAIANGNGNGKAEEARPGKTASNAQDGKRAKHAKGAKKKARMEPVAEKGLAPIMGARWIKPSGEVIACPVASVLALRHGLGARS